ncbi:MAG: AEC family transporter [Cytophagales bacterium]|nr:AEC family transporter [Cytophagales bacterium]
MHPPLLSHPVITSLLPVIFLIVTGYVAGKQGWIRAGATKDFSSLIFSVLLPPLLFRTMAQTHLENLQILPVLAYLGSMVILFVVMLAFLGFNQRGVILGLASTYSNAVMIGIALIGFAYGQAGQAVLFSLLSVHAVIMLTAATLMLEWLKLKAQKSHTSPSGKPYKQAHPAALALNALRNALLQPTTWPILVGLAYSQTGLGIPAIVDRPLQLLGQAFSPLALVLVGLTLSVTQFGHHIKPALGLSLLKNFVQPILVLGLGFLLGQRGLPLTVMVVAASLPMGANVFMFSQRYQESEDLITTSVSVSTVMALFSVALTMSLAPLIDKL